jgi:hypothetical protein
LAELPWFEGSSMAVQETLYLDQLHLMPMPVALDGYIELDFKNKKPSLDGFM